MRAQFGRARSPLDLFCVLETAACGYLCRARMHSLRSTKRAHGQRACTFGNRMSESRAAGSWVTAKSRSPCRPTLPPSPFAAVGPARPSRTNS
eukprot:2346256-Pleurochrysis_carterae.AAC.1